MRRVLILCDLVLAAAPARGAEEGVITLFDGKDLSEWTIPEGDHGHWKVLDGVIDYDARSEARGDKNLITRREFEDFTLTLEWRIKETPYENPNVPYVLPDGTHARDIHGKELKFKLPDSDSGVFLRDMKGKSQVNIWCWPIGSGEVYGYRMDKEMPPEVRAGVTPRTQADRPVGEWNAFAITLVGDRLTVALNGTTVIQDAELPGIPRRGPIALQHHGGVKDGQYLGPPSLVQFRNIRIKPLSASAGNASLRDAERPTRPRLTRPIEGIFIPDSIPKQSSSGRSPR